MGEGEVSSDQAAWPKVRRFGTNPLITSVSSPTLGDNINGPSVIRVPSWLPEPLGRYYMYFAHHSGTCIRLAYADDLEGPWSIHAPGALQLDDAPAFHNHIASPDVHVDEERKLIRMYFHAPARGRTGQWTGVATSEDGLHFTARPEILGKFYFRVWPWQQHWYAVAKNNNEGWGELYRASQPEGPFELRGNFLRDMRHAAVVVQDHTLFLFHSRVGDAPERIVVSTVDMRGDWLEWQPTEPREVMRPQEAYEGGRHPVAPSNHGSAVGMHQLRDPFVMVEEGRWLIFYSGAGEEVICGAELNWGDEPYSQE